MRASFRRTSTEEDQLEQKHSELSELRARHAAAKATLQQLREELAQFKRYCDQTLARRLEELERIEDEACEEMHRIGQCGNDGLDAGYDIKTTYRKIAKAVHPDFGAAHPSRLNRHELMLQANRAYAEADLRTLRHILGQWRKTEGAAGERAGEAELAELGRRIHAERQDLHEVNGQLDQLTRSCAWRLKLRLDREPVQETLASDMVAIADLSIARALRHLAVLKGGKESRRLRFPDDFRGTLYVRNRTSLSYRHWRRIGEARGDVYLDLGSAVRLDVKLPEADLGQLRKLRADDLQALFLYNAGDSDIDSILHLTGLEELYLSGERLGDAALARLSPLGNLKCLYIYQTGISDLGLAYLHRLQGLVALTISGNATTEEGIERFRKGSPAVKTVGFQWQR